MWLSENGGGFRRLPGFSGRYVVQRLAARGYIVRVAVRRPEAAKFLRPMGDVGQVVPLYAPVCATKLWRPARSRAPISSSISPVSWPNAARAILAASMPRAPGGWPGSRAQLVRQLVHVSAIGADPASPSPMGAARREGEAACECASCPAVILASLYDVRAGGSFLQPLRHMAARCLRFMPVVRGGQFQPVYVGDVADAVLAGCWPAGGGQALRAGRAEAKSFRQLIQPMLTIIERKPHHPGTAGGPRPADGEPPVQADAPTRSDAGHTIIRAPGAAGLAELGSCPRGSILFSRLSGALPHLRPQAKASTSTGIGPEIGPIFMGRHVPKVRRH